MNKSQLVTAVSEKSGFTKKDTEAFIASFVDVVEETVAKSESVAITGFGSFNVRDVAETSGVNRLQKDENGVVIEKPWAKEAHKAVSFKVGKNLKEAVL